MIGFPVPLPRVGKDEPERLGYTVELPKKGEAKVVVIYHDDHGSVVHHEERIDRWAITGILVDGEHSQLMQQVRLNTNRMMREFAVALCKTFGSGRIE